MRHTIQRLFRHAWHQKLLILNSFLGICLVIAAVYFYYPFHTQQVPKAQGANVTTSAQKIYNDCHAKQDWHECYKKEMAELTKAQGLTFSQNVLFAIQDVDSNSRNCHVIAHFMAREAYHRDPTHWLDLADQADINSCGGGFLHGILEAHIGDSPDQQINAVFADQVCQRKQDDFRERLCYHLFGHFFLVDQDGKLVQALPYCDQIATQYTYDCDDGLFMEDHQKLALFDHDIAPLPHYTPQYLTEVQKQCALYSGVRSNACWTEIAEVATKVYGYDDPQKIYTECYKAKNEKDQRDCYSKGVVVLSIYPGYGTPQKLLSICTMYKNDGDQYNRCNSYIISALMHYSVKYSDRAITLCSSIGPDYEQWCFGDLGQQLKSLASLNDRKQLCQNTPADYKASCVNE